MQVRTALYPDEIGVDNNLLKVMRTKECKVLLTVKSDKNDTRFECVLGKEEVESLIDSLNKCVEAAKEHGFKLMSAKADKPRCCINEPKQSSDLR